VWDQSANDGKGGTVEKARSPDETRTERDWFCQQVKHWERMLENPRAASTARSALRNMLYLERYANEMGVLNPQSREFAKLEEMGRKTQDAYRKQVEELAEIFPELGGGGTVTARAMWSDANLAHRDFYGHKDRRRWDNFWTIFETEFLLRTSVQMPAARFRLDLNLALAEQKRGMYDPEFRSLFKHRTLKLLQAGFMGAVEAAQKDLQEPVVDLEKGVYPGEGDDFEDFLDADCPLCSGRIVSTARRCPHCKMKIEGVKKEEPHEN